MLLTKKIKVGFISFAVLLVAALALPASAERRVQNAEVQREVADRLGEFKSTAFKLHREADLLQSHRHHALSWQTHANRLAVLKDQVNQMGRSLSELEKMKPQASETQKLAIE